MKLWHVQLLGRPTCALALVWMLIGDNWSHLETRTSIDGQRWPHSNSADVCKSPRILPYVTRRIFRRLFPAGHETTELSVPTKSTPTKWASHKINPNKSYMYYCTVVLQKGRAPYKSANKGGGRSFEKRAPISCLHALINGTNNNLQWNHRQFRRWLLMAHKTLNGTISL